MIDTAQAASPPAARTPVFSQGNKTLAFQNTIHLDGADLKYVGGYNQYIYDNRQDGDGGMHCESSRERVQSRGLCALQVKQSSAGNR